MKYLIFRTDRVGDFLITLPLIKCIKRNSINSQISVVTSPKNQEFVKKNNFVDKIYVLKSNKFIDKIKLFFELKKETYEAIVVSDKKNRSIIISLFLIAKKKIFNTSKIFQNRFLKIFFKFVFLDNEKNEDLSIQKILKKNCESLNFDLNKDDFIFFSKNQFKDQFEFDKNLKIDNSNYIVLHYDEKWELDKYSKLFRKATNLSDIKTTKENFVKLLFKLSEKLSMKIIITTGYIDTKIIGELKLIATKIENSLYELNFTNKGFYMITNQNFFSLSHLISKSNLFISCHGAFTHIASNYNVKILDIIEESKKTHYSKITSHMENYNPLFRKDSTLLFEEIINRS